MARISSKHQVTLPVESLKRAGLRAGDEVAIEAEGSDRIVVRRTSRCRASAGRLRRPLRTRLPGSPSFGRASVSGCVLDTDVVIAALDRRDSHHARAARAVTSM